MTGRDFILVTEDDEQDLHLTIAALAQSDADPAVPPVVAVRDGAEALDFLYARGEFQQRAPGRPVLLLLDLNMPRIDGWEVLRQLKSDERLRTIPVVVFTSSTRDSDVLHCYELGANAYVVKPADFHEFAEVVRDIRTFWTKRNFPPVPGGVRPEGLSLSAGGKADRTL